MVGACGEVLGVLIVRSGYVTGGYRACIVFVLFDVVSVCKIHTCTVSMSAGGGTVLHRD